MKHIASDTWSPNWDDAASEEFNFDLPCGCRFTYDHWSDEGFANVCMASCEEPSTSYLVGTVLPLPEAAFQVRAEAIGHQTPEHICSLKWEA
jgi:hypothetical protein